MKKTKGKITVTGGAGYIGSCLVKQLLDRGYEVVVLDKLVFGQHLPSEALKNPRLAFIRGDIRHIEDLMEAMEGADTVLHLASIVGDPSCELDYDETISTNVESTKTLVEIAKFRELKRIIFASTASVYGSTKKMATERNKPKPLSLYARTKLDSEKLILESQKHGIAPTVLRLSTVYGVSPRMRFDLVLNFLTAKAISEQKIDIFGGDQHRPLIHVKDVAEVFLRSIEAPRKKVFGEIFNVGLERNTIKIVDLAKLIKGRYPKTKLNIRKKDKDKRDYRLSFKKIQKVLNFYPKYDLGYGIDEVGKLMLGGRIKDFRNDKYYNVQYLYNRW